MKILIAAVGQKIPGWAQEATRDYLSRLPRDFAAEVKEVKAEPRQGQDGQRLRAAEGQRLLALAPRDAILVAMDEHGSDWDSERLARALSGWRERAGSVVFFLGGPDGLDEALRSGCELRLRLSSMTLPHALARVVLAEQLYRAWSILASHPYHRS